VVKVVDKFSAGSLRDQCRAWIAIVAGPRTFKDSKEKWLKHAAQRSKLEPRMMRALYYGEIADPEHAAVKALQAAVDRYEIESLTVQLDEVARRLRAIMARHADAGQGSLPLGPAR
jgi:hypothetical protein